MTKTPLSSRIHLIVEHSAETLEKIRRLAERPGTPGEGAAAKAALARAGAPAKAARPVHWNNVIFLSKAEAKSSADHEKKARGYEQMKKQGHPLFTDDTLDHYAKKHRQYAEYQRHHGR